MPPENLVEATITLATGGSQEQKKERLVMSKVFVLDTDRRPLDPVHPGRARIWLSQGKAAVFKRSPFTIILKAACDSPEVHPLRLKLDPGSQTSGLALVNDTTGEIVFAAEQIGRAHV